MLSAPIFNIRNMIIISAHIITSTPTMILSEPEILSFCANIIVIVPVTIETIPSI